MSVNISIVNNTLQPELFTYNVPALIFGVLLIIVIICGNVLVCLSVYKEKALKTTTNYFIVSLAVADLLLAVLVLPLFVYAEVSVLFKRNTVCLRHNESFIVFIAVSIPLNYNRKHVDYRQILLLSATWLLALAVASPVIFGINNVPQRDPRECKLEDNNYVVYSSVCSFFIPCPIMLLLYFGVFHGLRKWEESRKAKLRNSIQACRSLQHAAVAAALPPLGALPASLPRVIERDLAQSSLEELDDFTQPVCPFPPEYKNSPIQTVPYPDIQYSQPAQRRKRDKINGRERKAMRVLPVVVVLLELTVLNNSLM
ncbi:hypothetical protein cypCar_00046067 [Cyprinus carpio]|nr:hypothetical protein cypCar_00046067 [Cyprinus carpio]